MIFWWRSAFLLILVGGSLADMTWSRGMESSLEVIRMSVAKGDFYDANDFKLKTSTGSRHEYIHPRGGPTLETVIFTKTNKRQLVVDVTAKSPKAPMGDRFLTATTLDVRRNGKSCQLSTCCRVIWRGSAPTFLKNRIERAAESGATDAWRTWAEYLERSHGKEPAIETTTRLLIIIQRIFLCFCFLFALDFFFFKRLIFAFSQSAAKNKPQKTFYAQLSSVIF